MKSWTAISVGVANLDDVIGLWSGAFGMDMLDQKSGDDPDLALSWGLSADDIRRQALLATPGQAFGLLHFVEFNQPGPTVRDGAGKFDLCPKNLDVYVHDMPARVQELKAAGYSFHTDKHSEMTAPDGTTFREIHMRGHDDINIVLIEIIGMAIPFSPRGYAALGPVVTVVSDAAVEQKFYQEIFDLQLMSHNLLEGPDVESAFGLPPGAALDISIWGDDGVLGRVQLTDYRGVDGKNLYSRAVPKQRGILQITYETRDMGKLKKRIERAGIPWTGVGDLHLISGDGQFIRLHSPAGLRIDVFERER